VDRLVFFGILGLLVLFAVLSLVLLALAVWELEHPS
jgi:hypothetical protein